MQTKLGFPLLFVLLGDSYSETYTYDTGDGSLQSMTTAGGQTLSYTYDALKRHTATTVTKNGSTIFRVAKSYYNHATDSTRTTAQVQYYTEPPHPKIPRLPHTP